MTSLLKIVEYCDTLLNVGDYQDYAPNGLQIEGFSEVMKIVSGVTASQALIDAAVEEQADMVLVHHGYFWKGEPEPIVGIKRRRIKTLLENEISLLAYHLPLDGHPVLGNNAQLGRLWEIEVQGRFGDGPDGGIALFGELEEAVSIGALAGKIAVDLHHRPQVIHGGEHEVKRVGWCSGAAQHYIEQAAALGLDAYISGEISEPTVHIARELGIHYIAAGHHATERGGVKALGDHLADHFSLENHFVDISNPV